MISPERLACDVCGNREIPRPEHPRPQFFRPAWMNLNGEWEFHFDFGLSAAEQDYFAESGQWQNILVPFPPESERSGIGFRDFIPGAVYRREFQIPDSWSGKRLLLHFGAVDCECRVFVDDQEVGEHSGGQTSFEFDITDALDVKEKRHRLLVAVHDGLRDGLHGSGKQAHSLHSDGCFYSRVTGIWQTVWLEAVSDAALEGCRIVPDYQKNAFLIFPRLREHASGRLRITARFDSEENPGAESASIEFRSGIPLQLSLPVRADWSPDHPVCHTIELEVSNEAGEITDQVKTYAGMREICCDGDRLLLNRRPLFLRLVLDQGHYPESGWTAPSDEALRGDIELALAAGFNGARLHQKVFEERFHYWADRLGYLTWGEFGSWGINSVLPEARANFLREWGETVRRDGNHPSIIAWTPLNETRPFEEHEAVIRFPDRHSLEVYRQWVRDIYNLTRDLDPTRPVNDASGWLHAKTDLWTVHAYRENAASLTASLFPENAPVMTFDAKREVDYAGQPYLNDEFGGFRYLPADRAQSETGWGYYGCMIRSGNELCEKIAQQIDAMLKPDRLSGYCYTQLTDVEQEQNGLYCFDRTEKCPREELIKVFQRKPEWSQW